MIPFSVRLVPQVDDSSALISELGSSGCEAGTNFRFCVPIVVWYISVHAKRDGCIRDEAMSDEKAPLIL